MKKHVVILVCLCFVMLLAEPVDAMTKTLRPGALEPGCALCLKGKLSNSVIELGQPAEITVSGGTGPYTVTSVNGARLLPPAQGSRPEGGGEWRLVRNGQAGSVFRMDGLKPGDYSIDITDSKGEKLSVSLTVKGSK